VRSGQVADFCLIFERWLPGQLLSTRTWMREDEPIAPDCARKGLLAEERREYAS
jgi:hypothetical protein